MTRSMLVSNNLPNQIDYMSCFFLLALCCLTGSASTVVVDSPFGKIKGEIVTKDNSDQSCVVFKNIPYAKPPVGELRFSKPEPHPKIDGVFDGTDKRTVLCPQPGIKCYEYEHGVEDCLILNIYAKTKSINPGNTLKKVMVFIHGGGFVTGSTSIYDMSSFATSHDVICVTMNYRLGIFGFLSTGNEASPGNYGLWDQTMAIKWVKDNIKAFGGNPDDITISGDSAGGASVSYQSLSPVTKGLFSKAFSESGMANAVWAGAKDVHKHALTLAEQTGCWEGEIPDTLDLQKSELLMKCLRHLKMSAFIPGQGFNLSDAQFVPTVDGEFVPRKPSILLQDELYLESIGFYDRSYLVSITNLEFSLMKVFNGAFKESVLNNKETTETEKQDILLLEENRLKKFYLQSRVDSEAITSSLMENMMSFYTRRRVGDDALADMMTDLSFLIPSYEFLNAASKQKKCKSWFLYFNHFPAFMKGNYKGTCHAADLLYWHDMPVMGNENFLYVGIDGQMDDGDFRLKSMFSSLIAEFMKSGEPGRALQEEIPAGWPVYDPDNAYYLNFNLEPDIRSHLEREKRDLWLKTIPKWAKKTHAHTEL